MFSIQSIVKFCYERSINFGVSLVYTTIIIYVLELVSVAIVMKTDNEENGLDSSFHNLYLKKCVGK